MKNLKRALSFALASVMLVGMMVVGAGAVDFGDAEDIQNTEAVNTMAALGIINGKDDGNFDPEGIVTRAEMAKMICVAMNGGTDPNLNGGGLYPDTVGHWAAGYIDYCTNMGYVSGDTNGNFNPDATVTGTEAAKMILVALGYNAETEKFVNDVNWAININVLASTRGLYQGIGALPDTGLTRDNAAQMLYNGMDVNMVRYELVGIVGGNGVSQAVERDGVTIFSDRFGLETVYAYMTGIEYEEDRDAYTYTLNASAAFGGDAIENDDGVSVPTGTIRSEEDYSALFGQQVRLLYKTTNGRTTVYGIYAHESSILASGTVNSLPDMDADDTSFTFGGTTYRVDGDDVSEVPVFAYNRSTAIAGASLNTYEANGTKAYTIDLIDNDGDGRVNCAVVHPFTVTQVTYVGKSSFNTDAKNGVSFDDVNVYDDIAKDDFVMVVAANNTVDSKDTYTQIETIEGEIEATRSGSVRVDGTWYNYNSALTSGFAPSIDDVYELAIVNGFICGYDEVASGATMADYAVVVGAEGGNSLNSDRARLLFTDGTTEIVDTDEDYSDYIDTLVTYEVSKGEYVLTPASDDKDEAGFDVVLDGDYAYVSGGKSTIDGETIAADAVIFVQDSEGDWSVMTGSEFRRYATESVASVVNAYADGNRTGFNSVALACVTLNEVVLTNTGNYGYVTSAISTVRNDDGDRVSQFSFWNGEEQINDALADEVVSWIAKGDIFTYEINSDGSYTVNPVDSLRRAAIIAWNEDTGDIRFTDSTLDEDGTNVSAEVNSDTVIIGIDSDDVVGVEGVEPTMAIETETDGVYQANAYYLLQAGEVTLLVIDTYGDIPEVETSIELGTSATKAAVEEALAIYGAATINGDYTISEKINVGEGQTLTIAGDITASSMADVARAIEADGADIDAVPAITFEGGEVSDYWADADLGEVAKGNGHVKENATSLALFAIDLNGIEGFTAGTSTIDAGTEKGAQVSDADGIHTALVGNTTDSITLKVDIDGAAGPYQLTFTVNINW